MMSADHEGLFLETSAQIERVLNRGQLGRSIEETAAQFSRVGTSRFVQTEFEKVIGGLYELIADSIDRVQEKDRPIRFRGCGMRPCRTCRCTVLAEVICLPR